MLEVKEANDVYLSRYERFERGGSGEAWLLPIRKAAMARFNELGFPTVRDEEWRYTSVARIADTPFESPGVDAVTVTEAQIQPFNFDSSDRCLLVFVNGRFDSRLSTIPRLPDGVRVDSLAVAMSDGDPTVRQHLAGHACTEKNAFAALNTALVEDGAFVHVPAGVVAKEPIHLLFVTTASARAVVVHPRNLIVADANSDVTIVETYAGLGGGCYFTNAVTEIVVGENAHVDHCKIERESPEAFHIATLHLHQFRSSTITSHNISLGGALVRNEITALLDGEGSDCTLNGLSMVDGTMHVDNHLCVEHAKPHCDSREFYKGVLDGHGKCVFSGRIIVREDAQKTDAKQTNKSLLLSENAEVKSKPQLEIFADDVKCTHGATIGQVDDDAVFYLRSRGLTEEAARGMLIHAFARESITHVHVEPVRVQLEQLIAEWMPKGRIPREGA